VYHTVLIMMAVLFVGFFALGTWQVVRRTWKLNLIERVEQRVHAPAVPAPGPDEWQQIYAGADEYLHVRLTGKFLHQQESLAMASTRLGVGFWVMTPLQQADGTVVLVNRGFIPDGKRDSVADRVMKQPDATVTVTGLLRKTEPAGGFLRKNDAMGNRWYSRDVQAIATARGLHDFAPFFVDADATAPLPNEMPPGVNDGPPPEPVGGLTVINFHNNHLIYALTWYALALMIAGAAWHVVWDRRWTQRRADENGGFANDGSQNAGQD